MRKRYPVVILVVLVVAVALGASLAIADAGATTAWTCGSCHTLAATHTAHGSVGCASCHVNGTSSPPTPGACAGCHTTLPTSHPESAGCFAAGCHTAPSPSPTPTPTPTDTPTPTPTPTETSTSTPTPTPSPSATEDGDGGDVAGETEDIGFPTTGYPPSSGGSAPWLLIGALGAGGVTLLFAAWRFHTAAGRHD